MCSVELTQTISKKSTVIELVLDHCKAYVNIQQIIVRIKAEIIKKNLIF